MFEYTHKNHFQFGYYNNDSHQWMPPRCADAEHEFAVRFGVCKYYATNFRAECENAATLISQSADDFLNIMFSGGSESEVVVRTFLNLKIPFKVSIMKFKNDLNIHDISFAVVFCEQHGIKYDIFELDIKNFLDDEMFEYAERTQCPSPQLPATMWLADQIDGLPIMGSGEPYIAKVVPDDYVPGVSPYEPSEWRFTEKEMIQAWYRHFIIQGRDAIPGFFQYTPELMHSFLCHSTIVNLTHDRQVGKLSSVSSKSEMYRWWFPDMIPRPKFTGFERITEWDEVARENLSEKFGRFNRVVSTEYNDFMHRLQHG